jgi:molybdopterin-containing oxidoreductase family iron-sulfur binding subunit
VAKLADKSKGLTLALYETVALGDGSNANNATLQELPDPISKVTWDNFIGISPALAEKEGIKSNDVITVKLADKSITLPALIQPGLQMNTLAVAVGYGRTKSGKVGNGIGKNAFELASVVENKLVYAGLSVSGIEKVGKTYKLATTQDHHMMNPTSTPGQSAKGGLYKPYDKDRPLIQTTSYEDFVKNPESGKAPSEFPVLQIDGKDVDAKGMNSGHKYNGYRWGMTVDLTLCTGCSACVTACQIENNIPVVGRDEVRVGREMHWIRIDRYYIGDASKPETLEIAHQPVMCQHCENAPCETVCPVAATVHGSEGTNDMVYNRCVGTRYCSNNCPYKVRRFNWMLHWKDKDPQREPRHLALNPEVTVRTRGVMEKCTFCSSRIAEKKIKAKNEGRTLKDGELKTACQETCPADAISFGNTNDPEAQVTKNRNDKRAYKILDFLNVLPQVSYMTRVRNKTNA